MSLPPGFRIQAAVTQTDLQLFAQLALEYHRWLGVDLTFQAFEKEVASLPGCYSGPAGCILLLWQQPPSPSQPPTAVGCVAVRPLHTNTTASAPAVARTSTAQGSTHHQQQHKQPQQQTIQYHAQQQPQQVALPVAGSNGSTAASGMHANSQSTATATAAACKGEGCNAAASNCPPCRTEASSPSNSYPTAPAAAASPGPSGQLDIEHCDLSRMCEMKRLWVTPSHQGRGLGRALAAAAVAAAKARGYSHMVLDTLQSLTAANKLYAGLGFVQRAAYYHNPLPDVVYWQMDLEAEPCYSANDLGHPAPQ